MNSLSRLFFIAALIALVHFQSLAQSDKNHYLPSDIDELEAYLEGINRTLLQRIDGENSNKVKKLFKDRHEQVFEAVQDSVYNFYPIFYDHVNGILDKIYRANPEIKRDDFRFFIKNSNQPNAAYYGDGMFELNLGLLSSLDDDEVAFVLCHEIAHALLDHPLENAKNRVALLNSKETKDRIKSIERQKYGQTRAGLAVVDELKINMLDYTKESESEADSLGFLLLSKTLFKKEKSIKALSKLKLDDDMLFNINPKLDSVLNLETYPFKTSWVKQSTSLFDSDEVINEFALSSDTLSTHPEIDFRIERLQKIFNFTFDDLTGNKNFKSEILTEAHLKSWQYYLDKKQLDFALYHLIKMHRELLIDEKCYHSSMVDIFQTLYQAIKNHEIGKYVPTMNSISDEQYLNTIRLFIHKIELTEIRELLRAYADTYSEYLEETRLHEIKNNFNN